MSLHYFLASCYPFRSVWIKSSSARPALQPPRPRYTVIDLGGCEALAISNNGKVAGQCDSGSSARGFFWENGVMQSLGTLGGSWSIAYGVNDDGQVVGTSLAGSGYSGAFLWQNGAMQSLGSLGGNGPSGALAINNAGQVVGYSTNSTPQTLAFLWNRGVMDLRALNNGIPASGPARQVFLPLAAR